MRGGSLSSLMYAFPREKAIRVDDSIIPQIRLNDQLFSNYLHCRIRPVFLVFPGISSSTGTLRCGVGYFGVNGVDGFYRFV